jgi:hypothetical protein
LHVRSCKGRPSSDAAYRPGAAHPRANQHNQNITNQHLPPHLRSLNPQQLAAVTRPADQPLLILAGAGSGKTLTMTRRIVHILSTMRGARPSHILAVTFTKNAAAEMRERLAGELGQWAVGRMTISTFHSFCLKVCRAHAHLRGVPKDFAVFTTRQQRQIFTEGVQLFDREGVLPGGGAAGKRGGHGHGGGDGGAEGGREGFVTGGGNGQGGRAAAVAAAAAVRAAVAVEAGEDSDGGDEEEDSGGNEYSSDSGGDGDGSGSGGAPGAAAAAAASSSEAASAPLASSSSSASSSDPATRAKQLYRRVGRVMAEVLQRKAAEGRAEAAGAAGTGTATGMGAGGGAGAGAEAGAGGEAESEELLFCAEHYASSLRAAGALDFFDFVALATEIMRECPQVQRLLMARHRYVLVDEFQDTSAKQFSLLTRLAQHGAVTAVGDDDQVG